MSLQSMQFEIYEISRLIELLEAENVRLKSKIPDRYEYDEDDEDLSWEEYIDGIPQAIQRNLQIIAKLQAGLVLNSNGRQA